MLYIISILATSPDGYIEALALAGYSPQSNGEERADSFFVKHGFRSLEDSDSLHIKLAQAAYNMHDYDLAQLLISKISDRSLNRALQRETEALIRRLQRVKETSLTNGQNSIGSESIIKGNNIPAFFQRSEGLKSIPPQG